MIIGETVIKSHILIKWTYWDAVRLVVLKKKMVICLYEMELEGLCWVYENYFYWTAATSDVVSAYTNLLI